MTKAKRVLKPKRNKEQDKLKKVSEQIQVILLKNGLGLKPILSYSQDGIVPQVRLIDITKENNVVNDTNQGEVEESGDKDGTVESEQS